MQCLNLFPQLRPLPMSTRAVQKFTSLNYHFHGYIPYFNNPQLSFSKPPTFTFTTLNFHFHNSQLPLSQLSTFTSFNFHFHNSHFHNSHFHNSTLPTRVQFQISLTSFNFSDNSPRIASSSKNLPWRMMIVNDDNLEDQGSANTGIYFS